VQAENFESRGRQAGRGFWRFRLANGEKALFPGRLGGLWISGKRRTGHGDLAGRVAKGLSAEMKIERPGPRISTVRP